MNIKVVKHRSSFSNTINYAYDGKLEKGQDKVLDKKPEVILHSKNVIAPYDKEDKQGRKVLIQQFEKQNLWGKNDISKPCGHESLNFNPQDKISDEKLEAVTRDYIQKRGLENTQYIAIKHQDTKHLHVHVIYNRTNNQGKTIDSTYEKLHAKKNGIELSQKYQLTTTERLTASQERTMDYQKTDKLVYEQYGKEVKELQKDPIIGRASNQHHLKMLSKHSNFAYEERKEKTIVNGKEYNNDLLKGLFRANTAIHKEKAIQTKFERKMTGYELKKQLKQDRINGIQPKIGLQPIQTQKPVLERQQNQEIRHTQTNQQSL